MYYLYKTTGNVSVTDYIVFKEDIENFGFKESLEEALNFTGFKQSYSDTSATVEEINKEINPEFSLVLMYSAPSQKEMQEKVEKDYPELFL